MHRVHAAAAVLLLVLASSSNAQDSSLFREELPPGKPMPLTLNNGSWTYIPQILPRRLSVYDRVTVRVDELARMQSEGEVERRKDAQYDAILQDWIHLIGLKAIKPNRQTDGDQRIKGQLQQLYRAEADVQTRESLALNIACTVADIRPNGDLVLEGHKQIHINDDYWEVSLTGICRHEDVGADNVVLSRNIVNLKLDKRERGHTRDGYKRGWFLRWFDEFHPF
jgi:flagellar L-ring protein precursor FlgH